MTMQETLIVDFTKGRLGYRCHPKRAHHEPLAKAIGLKPNYYPTIIDTTAGLGQDAFILASLGCAVFCLEREHKVATVLKNAISHAQLNETLAPIAKRIHCIEGDSIDYLANLKPLEYPDVIYCDPMFEPRSKSAKVKKGMQWLQATVPFTRDAKTLGMLALEIAKDRVIIKRHRKAPNLLGTPTFSIEGRQCRFDIYQIPPHKEECEK
ncbi:MAG TPA: class I SAM-dependent methyltransferase [Gammaproteobacteria bacterium]|nr:class I SAM-dependent methyltransferase [Gammaproteobacteria bacterium]